MGENGAGKSTLMSVLFGLYQPDSGVIKINGKEVRIKNPNDATALNIGMVHQHFKLVEVFSVLDNIILGMEPSRFGFINKKEAKVKVCEISEKYGLRIDPDAKIEDISVGMQQRVFGNWKPLNILFAALFFSLFKVVGSYASSISFLPHFENVKNSQYIYQMLPYVVTMVVLIFTSKKSRAPKAEGIPYDKGQR